MSLSTVYGLSGIPNGMIDRIEVVKGPASSLYGSEAMGGIIDMITKNASLAPKLSVDVMATSWQEYTADLAGKFSLGKKVQSLIGLNYYRFQKPINRETMTALPTSPYKTAFRFLTNGIFNEKKRALS